MVRHHNTWHVLSFTEGRTFLTLVEVSVIWLVRQFKNDNELVIVSTIEPCSHINGVNIWGSALQYIY